MFLTLRIARLPLSHRPTVLRSPVNGSEAPMWKGFTCSGMCCAPPEPKEFRRLRSRRATPFPPNLAFPNPNLDSRLLVEQSQPVVRRFVLQAVHSKTGLDTTPNQIRGTLDGPTVPEAWKTKRRAAYFWTRKVTTVQAAPRPPASGKGTGDGRILAGTRGTCDERG